MLRLRLRGPDGSSKTVSYSGELPHGDFLSLAQQEIGSDVPVVLLAGFPPKLCTEDATTPLGKIVSSGDTLVLRHAEVPKAAPTAVDPSAVNSSSTAATQASAESASAWSCPVCTLENEISASQCAVCGAANPRSGAKAVLERQPDDNSCLFHAAAFLLSPTSSPTSLRAAIVQALAILRLSRGMGGSRRGVAG